MKSKEDVFKQMQEEMPYNANFPHTKPYILEAMEVYAKEYHKEQIKALSEQTTKQDTSEANLNIGDVNPRLYAKKLIVELDRFARDYDCVDYGLPIDSNTKEFYTTDAEKMIDLILPFLNER